MSCGLSHMVVSRKDRAIQRFIPLSCTPFTAPTIRSSSSTGGAASTGASPASTGGNVGVSSGATAVTSAGGGGAQTSSGAVGSGSSNAGGGGGSSLSGGAIAGIVIGSVVGLALILLLLWCFACGGLAGRGKKTGGFSDVDEQRRHREPSQVDDSHVEMSGVTHHIEGEEVESTA